MLVEAVLLAHCLSGDIDTRLVESIIKIESNGYKTALGVDQFNGVPFKSDDKAEVVIAAKEYLKAGYTVGIGLMQINAWNIERLGESLITAIDPCVNLTLGETIMIENLATARSNGYQGEAALQAALSMYNTGNFEYGFKNGYVDKVWSHYKGRGDEKASRGSDISVSLHFNSGWVDLHANNVSKGLRQWIAVRK